MKIPSVTMNISFYSVHGPAWCWGLVQMFVPGETEQKNQNAQLLLPYNSEWINFCVVSVGYPLCIKPSSRECLLPLFYECGLFRYITGPLAVTYLIKNERNCHVLMMPFSAFAFHHSKRYNTAVNRRKLWRKRALLGNCVRGEKNQDNIWVSRLLWTL